MSNGLSTSSIGRKFLMALSGFFMLLFLTQHLVINLLSVISPNSFNNTAHFMGTNPLIQFVMQPILILSFSPLACITDSFIAFNSCGSHIPSSAIAENEKNPAIIIDRNFFVIVVIF